MKSLKFTLLFIFVPFLLMSQSTCQDFGFELILAKINPSGDCYNNLVFTARTPNLLNGVEPQDETTFCSDPNNHGYSYYKLKLQIIQTATNTVVAEKTVTPDSYDSFSNNNYFYRLNWDNFINSSGQYKGKLTIISHTYIIQNHNGFYQCPGGPAIIDITCESTQITGCPPPKPNLRLKALTVNNNGQNYNMTTGQVPNLYYGENSTFEVTIENNGNATANSSPFALYASAFPNAFNQNQDVYQFISGDGGSIAAGSTKKVTVYATFYDYIGNLRLYNNSIYRIYTYMDHVNQVQESNETLSDNIAEFVWKFIKIGGETDPNGGDPCVLCPTEDPGLARKQTFNPQVISIYNFSGALIKTRKVQSQFEAQQLIEQLPDGLYIIQTPYEVTKILKN